jgi:predicted metalloprotease with PDZ domain
VHHNGDEEQVDAYVNMAQKVVAEQIAIFDGPAKFDYGEYTFIADYLPYVFGDGMEHRNSTILTSKRSLKGENALKNLYTLSHEFFHSWNVERLRPDDLEPFNFTDANVSEALWFAEGFTSYYDDLIIRRADLIDDKKYAADWAGTLNYVLNSPGNSFYNPREMSMQAPFVDAATSVDAQNKPNTFISYYSWGSVLGLGLDLSLRTHFEQVTLDDYMRLLWNKYGKSEDPYTIDDLRLTLAELTDSTAFANNFFERYIDQGEHPDLKSLLAKAGFSLQKANPGRAVLQFGSQKIDYKDGVARITENTLIESPLYKAGLDRGDTIHMLGGESVRNAKDVQQILARYQPGDEISITFTSLGDTKERSIKLSEDPALELVPFELTDQEFTDEMKEFREQWLGSKAE